MNLKTLLKSVLIIVVILSIVGFCYVVIKFNAIPLETFPTNFTGASLGALIGALITALLLVVQSTTEEEKGKNIKILEKKTKIFKGFIKDIWDAWVDQKIDIEKYQELTKSYTYLIIYIKNKKRLKKIGECLKNIGTLLGTGDKDKFRENIVEGANGSIILRVKEKNVIKEMTPYQISALVL